MTTTTHAGFALTKTTTKGTKTLAIGTDKAALRQQAVSQEKDASALSAVHANAALKTLKERGYAILPINWSFAA